MTAISQWLSTVKSMQLFKQTLPDLLEPEGDKYPTAEEIFMRVDGRDPRRIGVDELMILAMRGYEVWDPKEITRIKQLTEERRLRETGELKN